MLDHSIPNYNQGQCTNLYNIYPLGLREVFPGYYHERMQRSPGLTCMEAMSEVGHCRSNHTLLHTSCSFGVLSMYKSDNKKPPYMIKVK